MLAGAQGMRAGIVSALYGTYAAGAVNHGGRDGITVGSAGRYACGSDLVGQFQGHVFFGAHSLCMGQARQERECQGRQGEGGL